MRSPELALITTATIWSLNFSIMKFALGSFEPFAFALVRFSMAGAVMYVIARATEGPIRFERQDVPHLTLAALVGIPLNQVGVLGALTNTTATNASLIYATVPILAAVMAIAMRQDQLAPRHWLGIAIGTVGVMLIVLGGDPRIEGNVRGILLASLGAATWALYSVLVRPLMSKYSAGQLTAFMMLTGGTALLPLGIPAMLRQPWQKVVGPPLLALVFTTLVSTVFTTVLYFRAIRRVGASRATLFTYLQPLVGVLFAAILLAERATAVQLVGGVVVLVGVVYARPRAALPAAP